MDKKIRLIVEGDGDVEAAPALVRRLLYEQHQRYEFNRIEVDSANGKTNITKPGGLEKFLERARRDRDCAGMLVILDADEADCQCPPRLAIDLAQRAQALRLPFPVFVVCACCEYESWFLINLENGIREEWLQPDAQFDGDAEQKCGAKEWLTSHMPPGHTYKETIDQVKMTARLDISQTIERSRSFRRTAHAVEELLHAVDSQVAIVTPLPNTADT